MAQVVLGASPSIRLLSVAEAQERLLGSLRRTEIDTVPLSEAHGRVLAETVRCRRLVPLHDNSAMDGYAVVAQDCSTATPTTPVLLPIRAESRAGHPAPEHQPGTATLISTGAPLPAGADAVVRLEDTRRVGDHVAILRPVLPGNDVRRAGEDLRLDDVVVPSGRRLRPVDIAALAGSGTTEVLAHRRPRVAVVSTGDELVSPDVQPLAHQVVDCNRPMLAAAIEDVGGLPVCLPLVGDDRQAIGDLLRSHAPSCDLIVTTAGVSVGMHDELRAAVEQWGRVDVWRIAVRPGKPLLIGEIGGTPLIGLPGNPVSSAVTFELFVRPAVLALQGATDPHRRRFAVRLAEDVSTPRDLETYLRVRLEGIGEDGLPWAFLSGNQGSSMLKSLAAADALAVAPVGIASCPRGTVLMALEVT